MIVSDKIERQEQEVIAPLPVVHGEEKVQDYKDSEEDICQRPSCKPDTCGTVCHDCEDIIYYVGKSSHTKRICHSKIQTCICWTVDHSLKIREDEHVYNKNQETFLHLQIQKNIKSITGFYDLNIF